jgi:hypothetical protein
MRPAVESAQIELPRVESGRSALALGASLAAHLLLGTLAVVTTRREAADPSSQPPAVEQRVELAELPLYVEPPKTELPRPELRRPEPPAPEPPRAVPRPQVRRDQPLPEEVTVRPEPPPRLPLGEIPPATAPETADQPPRVESPFPTQLSAAEVMESEARRLFGPRNAGADRPLGPLAARSWATEVTEDRDNDCTPRPPARREPGTPPEMGEVAGIVYREGTRQPLGGAFLQIMGTPYSAFADDRGAYTLRFDKALIDACRTQYVQVSKDGFAPRRLILSLGQRVSNDIPMARR